jgi:signal transduction histidine kinase
VRVGEEFGSQTEQALRFRELAFQVMHSGQQVQLRELPVGLASGGTVHMDLLLHPLRNERGELDGVILIGTDVTSSVEARRALDAQSERAHRAEVQLSTIVERGPFFVVTLDPTGRMIYIGGGEVRKRGEDPARLIGRNALELYKDDAGTMAALRRALAGESFSTLVDRPGVTYEVHYSPVRDASGALEMIVGVGVDVSRRMRAEEERARIHDKMLQTQKLESLGVLAGGIAHDFNNLLTVIQGNAQVALARLDEKDPVRDPIDDILKAAMRASELTRQMLAYSGKGRFQIGPLDLRHQVAEIGNLLRTSIPKKVSLRLEQPSYLPAVQGDASQLQQVLMNLVLNAAEAMGASEGEVTVRLGEEDVGADGGGDLIGRERLPEGRYVRLTVEDSGVGMDPQIQARIFDPFFTTKATGRGLGLAAVLGIVRSHGGAIRIASAPGRGTRFEVLLPAAGAVAQSPTSSEPLSPGNGTVLVIDDEASVRTAAGRMLSMLGYDVLEAADGEQGAEIMRLRKGDIDVVLLDVTMPRLSGEETLQLLRTIAAETPVIMFSGYAEDEVAARLGHLRPAAVLQKPFTRQQLAAALQLALQGA